MEQELSIIIVNWNVCDLLRDCLASLPAGGSAGPEIIVVDNASSDGSSAMVADEFPHVQLIANSSNRGFTAANNQGYAASSGRCVFFLNPDTVVQPGAIETMVRYLEAHPEVGVAGPQLRYADGELQSSRRRFLRPLTALFESTPLEWHWRSNPWARRYRMDDIPADAPQEVDWLVGAALLFRREVLERVGCFDERFFMYSEESDLCLRARAAGWKVVYLPHAVVTHYEGKSSEKAVAARHIRFHTSRIRYLRKHHGPAAAELVRLVVRGMFAVEYVVEAAKRLAGSRGALREARMAAYRQLLRADLR